MSIATMLQKFTVNYLTIILEINKRGKLWIMQI